MYNYVYRQKIQHVVICHNIGLYLGARRLQPSVLIALSDREQNTVPNVYVCGIRVLARI